MAYIFDQSVFLESELSESVRSKARKISCSKTETIFREGDEDGGLIQIIEGIGEVQMPTVDGEVILTHLLWPGDWIGEGHLLTGEPRSRYLIARTDLVYLHISCPDLIRSLQNDPQGWKAIGRMSHHHQRVAMRSYLDSSIRDPAIRCLATLLRLGGHSLARPIEDFSRNIPVSHEELGRMTNLCRNSIGKALHRLAEEDLVHACYRKLKIPSMQGAFDRLAKLSA